MKIFLGIVVLLSMSSGCTNITIKARDGTVSVKREFGFVTVSANPETDAIVSEIVGLGYMSSPMGVSVGFGYHTVALLPSSCRIVLWPKGKGDLRELESLLRGNQSICPIETANDEEKNNAD